MANNIKSYNTVNNRWLERQGVFTSRLLIVLALALAGYVGFKGVKFIADEKYRTQVLTSVGARDLTPMTATLIPQEPASGQSAPIVAGGGSGSSAASSSQSAGAKAQAQAAAPSAPAVKPTQKPSTACGNSAIPEGACMAILSIEQNGAKNNPYVVVDTSQLPDGTKFSFDKSTWSSFGDTTGAISAKASFLIKTFHVDITFTFTDNAWKVTAYTQV